MDNESGVSDLCRRLLHRWLVQYNPLYLASAALVLGGMTLISRGLATESTVFGQVGVAVIAEVYAAALIAGAALLTRIGLRRPAVMLALLTVLYQGDLTLHTETCAYLGIAGVIASAGWLALFVGKLYALAWAVQLRLSPSAVAIPSLGAAGLVVLPRLLPLFDAASKTSIIALWVFALLAAALWTARPISSRVPLNAWGRTVLHRSVRATWIILAVLTLCHVLFWTTEAGLSVWFLLPVATALSTRWVRRELTVWCVACATLVIVALALPSLFSAAALMTAVVLALRARRAPVQVTARVPPNATAPYRTRPEAEPPHVAPSHEVAFAPASERASQRLLLGALTAVYLAAWTHGWTGAAWPDHVVVLDVLLTAVLAFAALRRRAHLAWAPLVATYGHYAVQTGLITSPTTTLEWGLAFVGLGFCLLLTTLIVSWRLRKHLVPQ